MRKSSSYRDRFSHHPLWDRYRAGSRCDRNAGEVSTRPGAVESQMLAIVAQAAHFGVSFVSWFSAMAADSLEEGLLTEELIFALTDGASLGRASLERAARACPPALIRGLSSRGLLSRSRLAIVAVQDDSFQVDVVREFLSETDMNQSWQSWADLLEASGGMHTGRAEAGASTPQGREISEDSALAACAAGELRPDLVRLASSSEGRVADHKTQAR